MSEAAARRYAGALFELSHERGAVDAVSEGLMSVRSVLSSDAGAAKAFFDPKVASAAKKGLVAEKLAAGAHPFVVNLLKLLVDRRRERDFAPLVLAFFERLEEERGVLRVKVETALPLDDEGRARLTERLSEATGKTVIVTDAVVPELVGGMRLLVGSTLIDGSIKRRFENLEARLKQVV